MLDSSTFPRPLTHQPEVVFEVREIRVLLLLRVVSGWIRVGEKEVVMGVGLRRRMGVEVGDCRSFERDFESSEVMVLESWLREVVKN